MLYLCKLFFAVRSWSWVASWSVEISFVTDVFLQRVQKTSDAAPAARSSTYAREYVCWSWKSAYFTVRTFFALFTTWLWYWQLSCDYCNLKLLWRVKAPRAIWRHMHTRHMFFYIFLYAGFFSDVFFLFCIGMRTVMIPIGTRRFSCATHTGCIWKKKIKNKNNFFFYFFKI